MPLAVALALALVAPAAAAPGNARSAQPATSAHRAVVGADRLAAAGVTGRGVTVALVDTGVADLPQLRGRTVPVDGAGCLNLSAESGCADAYGHGTFMAGLVASVAPGARILSVKVAGRDGSTDVSKVLAAIQWVVTNADRYGVGVLNLSLGTDATQDWRVDPLNYAVERAWAAGVTVVTAASNRGPRAGTVTKPGDDPWVLTVGAIDDRGTPGTADDRVPGFSARGPAGGQVAKPDLAAPGVRLRSLRAPGSHVEQAYGGGPGAYRAGSGTSMAAAVVSGVAALALHAHPSWSPDRLKHALVTTARQEGRPGDRPAVGHGVVDGWRAVNHPPPGVANRGLARSSGRGSLDASRGSVRVDSASPPGLPVAGEHTAQSALLAGQLALWDPVGYVTGDWTARTWPLSPLGAYRFLPTVWASEPAGKNWQGAWYGSWG